MTTDHSELMQVDSIRVDRDRLLVQGTIMQAVPVVAVVSGTELRKAVRLIGLRNAWGIFRLLLQGRGA